MAKISISSMDIEEAIIAIAKCFPSVKVLKTGPMKATISGEVNILDKIKAITNAVTCESIEEVSAEIIEKERIIQEAVGHECCKTCESRACFGCPGGF